jgi:hypothetical protein
MNGFSSGIRASVKTSLLFFLFTGWVSPACVWSELAGD